MKLFNHRFPALKYAIALGLLLFAGILLNVSFQQLPLQNTNLAIDWRQLWAGLRGGSPTYGPDSGLYNPPWSILPLLPLGLLPLRASWALLSLATLIILLISVPTGETRWQWGLGLVLLMTAFPTIRHFADGNLQAVVIAGVLLLIHAYRARRPWLLGGGVLLATAKPQETWLLLLVLAGYVWFTWPRRLWLRAGFLVSVVVLGTSVLWGRHWFGAMFGISESGSIMDVSLIAVLGRVSSYGLILTWLGILSLALWLTWRTRPHLSRPKAAWLITASLLLAPYSGGNSYLTVLAVGLIPLLTRHPRLIGGLLCFINLPYLASPTLRYHYEAYYWAVLLLCTLLCLTWVLWQNPQG